MNVDIFTTDDDNEQARKAVPDLTRHPGWKFIERALDANISFLNVALREKRDFASIEQVYALQDRITDFETYKQLPATITAAAQEDITDEEEDIYDVPAAPQSPTI
jgi:hypothetical protein